MNSQYLLIKQRTALDYSHCLFKWINNPDFSGDWWKRYFPEIRKNNWIQAFRPYTDIPNGCPYDYELYPNGAFFFLFQIGSEKKLTKTRIYLKNNRDVVGIKVYKGKLIE